MHPYAYINGRIVRNCDAVVSIYDRGFLYGRGLFETLRAYNYTPFMLRDHLRRMLASAKRFGIRYNVSFNKLNSDLRELLKRNKLPDCVVRIMLSAGAEGGKPILSAIAKPLPPTTSSSARVELAKWHKNTSSLIHGHKTLNYLENVLSREAAQRNGFFEVIFTDEKGNILEGSCSNIFIVKNDRIYTPPLATRHSQLSTLNSMNVLPGITRKVVFYLVRKAGISVVERPLRSADLLTADEAFITNSLIEIMPVSHLDGRKVGGKDKFITPILIGLYRSAVYTVSGSK